MSSPVEVEDIQIRLSVKLQGVLFVTTWYGPEDVMRFAAIKMRDEVLSEEEEERLEGEARSIFDSRIKELETALLPVL